MRILIVEDNYISQEFLKEIMEEWGACNVVESGEAAVEEFASAMGNEPYSIVFMDIMLPGIDGLKALELIREKEMLNAVRPENEVKAIITTALDDDVQAARAFIQGQAIAYINKPVRRDMVEEELRKFQLIS